MPTHARRKPKPRAIERARFGYEQAVEHGDRVFLGDPCGRCGRDEYYVAGQHCRWCQIRRTRAAHARAAGHEPPIEPALAELEALRPRRERIDPDALLRLPFETGKPN